MITFRFPLDVQKAYLSYQYEPLQFQFFQISQITSKDEGWYDCQVNTEPKLNSKSFLKVFEKGVLFDGGGSKSWRVRQSPIQESSTSPSSSYRIRSSSKPNLSTKPYHQLQDSPLRPSGVVPQIQKFLHPGI